MDAKIGTHTSIYNTKFVSYSLVGSIACRWHVLGSPIATTSAYYLYYYLNKLFIFLEIVVHNQHFNYI